jgi:hypothetical protein
MYISSQRRPRTHGLDIGTMHNHIISMVRNTKQYKSSERTWSADSEDLRHLYIAVVALSESWKSVLIATANRTFQYTLAKRRMSTASP